MSDFVNWFLDFLSGAMDWLSTNLNICPFPDMIASLDTFASSTPFFGWINWFVPVGSLITLVAVWLTALAAYYLIQILMRWVKAIR